MKMELRESGTLLKSCYDFHFIEPVYPICTLSHSSGQSVMKTKCLKGPFLCLNPWYYNSHFFNCLSPLSRDVFPHSFTVGYVTVSKLLLHCWCDWHFFMQQDCVHMKEICLVLRIREFPFSFQESIYLLAKKGPRPKLHPLISSNEDKGWKFIQIPDYVKKQTSMSFWHKECWESMPSSCMFGLLLPTAKCVILSEELLSLPLKHSQSSQVSEICILRLFATGKSQSVVHRDWKFGHLHSYRTQGSKCCQAVLLERSQRLNCFSAWSLCTWNPKGFPLFWEGKDKNV